MIVEPSYGPDCIDGYFLSGVYHSLTPDDSLFFEYNPQMRYAEEVGGRSSTVDADTLVDHLDGDLDVNLQMLSQSERSPQF